jgi:hypothetical protein
MKEGIYLHKRGNFIYRIKGNRMYYNDSRRFLKIVNFNAVKKYLIYIGEF